MTLTFMALSQNFAKNNYNLQLNKSKVVNCNIQSIMFFIRPYHNRLKNYGNSLFVYMI